MKHRSARTTVATLLAVLWVAALLPLGGGVPGAGAVAYPGPPAPVTAEESARADVPALGSSGGGDPYFPADGNGGYDVAHYDIRNRYHFSTRLLTGTTRITARAGTALSGFHLDLLLRPVRVLVDGVPARFGKPTAHELRILPARPIAAGQTFVVTVSYRGRPSTIAYQGERSFKASATEAAAVGQPHMAPWWFPANDHPRDKARFDITMVVGKGRQVVSNGRLVERRRTARTTTFHWRVRDPMATYQAFFVAGDLVQDVGHAHGLHYRNAVSARLSPREQQRTRHALLRTPALASWLQGQLGAYPFETTGGVRTALPIGFALENQTRPVYPRAPGTDLLVHELAHQWLGNSVGLERWKDIWLNEGIATWLQWRYLEARRLANPQARLVRQWRTMPASAWALRIGDPGPRNLFDWAVYERGAMTVQALRHRVGEQHFWQVLRGWVALNRNATATTEDLMALAEQISGEDLDSFWQAWLFTPARPAWSAATGLV